MGKEVIRKPQFIDQYAEHLGIPKKDAEVYVSGFLYVLTQNLIEGNRVQFLGFGDFEARERAARKGRNPKTGEQIDIPATRVPAFKPGKTLRDQLKGVAELKQLKKSLGKEVKQKKKKKK